MPKSLSFMASWKATFALATAIYLTGGGNASGRLAGRMAPGTNTVMKLFRGSTNPGQSRVATKVPRLSRRSSGLAELAKLLNSEASLYVLDLGYTSPSNIRYFTERGHKIYSEDLLVASTDPALLTKDDAGNSVPDDKQFLADNLV